MGVVGNCGDDSSGDDGGGDDGGGVDWKRGWEIGVKADDDRG